MNDAFKTLSPTGLINLTVKLHGDRLAKGTDDERIKLLQNTLDIWWLAATVTKDAFSAVGSVEEYEASKLLAMARTADGERPISKNFNELEKTYSFDEACEQLGYKGSRNHRSFFDLINKAVHDAPDVWNGLKPSAVKSIRMMDSVDEHQLNLLKEFKNKMVSLRASSGGKKKAQNRLAQKKPVK